MRPQESARRARSCSAGTATDSRAPPSCASSSTASKPGSQPLDRLARRARLAALDLAHVLLREALAGELRLREALRDPQLAHAIPERRSDGWGGAGRGGQLIAHGFVR